MKPDLLILAPLPDFLRHPLEASFTCHDFFHADDRELLLRENGTAIRAIVQSGGTVAPIELLERLPALEIITVFGVGYDGVPVEYCKGRGIHITNTPDVLTDDVADIAVALVHMTSRSLPAAERFLLRGAWEKGAFPLTWSLKQKVAGIVGLGRIGKAIATRLAASGMSIAYTGRRRQTEVDYAFHSTLGDLADVADFLIIACPGGEATRHLVNATILNRIGPEGTLINISRGSVVDETALIHALEKGAIRAAGLDVFETEPLVPPALSALSNVVLLPHVGSATWETRNAMADLCVKNLRAHFSGQPLLTPAY